MAQGSADATAAFRAAELAGWQARVAAYDRYLSPLTTEIGERLLDAAGVGAASRVLDIACGPGRTTAAAAGRSASVVGVDFSERMIDYATSLFPAIEFRVADAESLPFADAGFDAVVVNFGVLHFGRPDCALVEACRVLRPGGCLAFSLWAGPGEHVGMRIMFDAIERHGRLDAALPEGPPQFLFAEPGACASLLTSAGFDADSIIHSLIRRTWRLPAPNGLFEAFTDGTVRIALLLAAHTPTELGNIRTAVAAASRTYVQGGELQIPAAAVLVTARRA